MLDVFPSLREFGAAKWAFRFTVIPPLSQNRWECWIRNKWLTVLFYTPFVKKIAKRCQLDLKLMLLYYVKARCVVRYLFTLPNVGKDGQIMTTKGVFGSLEVVEVRKNWKATFKMEVKEESSFCICLLILEEESVVRSKRALLIN